MMKEVRSSLWAALALGALASTSIAGDKLDKDDKKWLEQVQALIQSDEQDVFRNIPKADRAEFQVIFWARRNPTGPDGPANEFKDQYLKAVAQADKKFGGTGRPGSMTDCGRVFLILGPPDDMRTDEQESERSGMSSDGSMTGMSGMARSVQVWTYRNRPKLTFEGGKLEMRFDERCSLPGGSALIEQLGKKAATLVVVPEVKPEIGSDGRLVKLADILKRKVSPAKELLSQPREDFTFEQQQKLTLLGQNGTYAAGLLRVPASGLTVTDEAGKKKVTVLVATELLDVDGKVETALEGQRVTEVGTDGTVIVSYATMGLPGAHKLRIAVADPVSKKGSLKEVPLLLPDYTPPGLKIADVQVATGIDEVANPDSNDPLIDFVIGNGRFHPRFGNVFKKSESPVFVCLGYNATSDPATGKPSVTTRFEVYKVDKKVMESQNQTFDTERFWTVVGPVPLSTVEPGLYRVKVVVTDNVSKKELTKIAPYEVVP
jgi:GWxTD domain-containing protein